MRPEVRLHLSVPAVASSKAPIWTLEDGSHQRNVRAV